MLRYYPSFKIITNLNSQGGEFTLDGKPYKGKYYLIYDGRAFSGPSPQVGPSKKLERVPNFNFAIGINSLPNDLKLQAAIKTGVLNNRIPGKPNSYYPQPVESDYKKGYLIRYFTKKENENGFVIEISQEEYNSIVNGSADYDIRLYQVIKILWKITGPLNNRRESQYNVIPGIIDTNKRLVETANKNFLGIVDFIGGDYTKFARPT